MSEAQAWSKLRPLLKGLDPVRVENLVCPGTPDINYLDGWIELKYLRQWPKRDGIVKLDHFTNVQKAWIARRVIHGGLVFVMLVVDNEWLLFWGMNAVKFLGVSQRDVLYSNSLCAWESKPEKMELQKWIRKMPLTSDLVAKPPRPPCFLPSENGIK